jgi:hypothetical protein
MSALVLVHHREGAYELRLLDVPSADLPESFEGDRFDVPEVGRENLKPLSERMPGEAFVIPPSVMVDLRSGRPAIRTWALAAWDGWSVAEIAAPLAPEEVQRYVDHVRAEALRASGEEERATTAARQARVGAAGTFGLAPLLAARAWVSANPLEPGTPDTPDVAPPTRPSTAPPERRPRAREGAPSPLGASTVTMYHSVNDGGRGLSGLVAGGS